MTREEAIEQCVAVLERVAEPAPWETPEELRLAAVLAIEDLRRATPDAPMERP